MLPLIAIGVMIGAVLVPARQANRSDGDVAAPCPVGSVVQTMPTVGIGRPRLPRVRKQVVGDPSSAFLDAKVDGRVVVSGIVDTDGTLCDIRVVHSSHAGLGLEHTAIASARQWRFTAATRDGAATRAPVRIEFVFSAWSDSGRPGQRGRTAGAEIVGADPLPGESRPRGRR
ncbi:energy transducer TonB [Luteitalea sp.]